MAEPVMKIIAFVLAWVFLGICFALCGVAFWVTFSFFAFIKDTVCTIAYSIRSLIRKIKRKVKERGNNGR